jgi:hypothetical protein
MAGAVYPERPGRTTAGKSGHDQRAETGDLVGGMNRGLERTEIEAGSMRPEKIG